MILRVWILLALCIFPAIPALSATCQSGGSCAPSDTTDSLVKCDGLVVSDSADTSGALASHQRARQYPLSAGTWADLEVEHLILPIADQYSPSWLGRQRLEQMLMNLSLDASEIRARQEAVRELAENTPLRNTLETIVKAFATTTNEKQLAKYLNPTESRIPKRGALAGEIFSATVANMVWAGPTAILTATQDMQSALSVGFAVSIVAMQGRSNGYDPMAYVDYLRARHLEVKELLRAAHEVSKTLMIRLYPSEGADGRMHRGLLRGIAETLAMFSSPDADNFQDSSLKRSYSNLQNGWKGKASNILGVGSYTMRDLHRKLEFERARLLQVTSAFADLAAFLALGQYAAAQPGLVYPTIYDNYLPPQIRIENGHHPHLFMKGRESSVANSIALSSGEYSHDPQFGVLTGANAGGKSTWLNMIAAHLLFGSLGAPIPAERAQWTPMGVLSTISTSGSIQEGKSFFQKQAQDLSFILRKLDPQTPTLLIADEMLTGTTPAERVRAIGAAIEFAMSRGTLGIIATHDRSVASLARQNPRIAAFQIGEPGIPGYVITPGVSTVENSIDVLADAGVPKEYLEILRAMKKAASSETSR